MNSVTIVMQIPKVDFPSISLQLSLQLLSLAVIISTTVLSLWSLRLQHESEARSSIEQLEPVPVSGGEEVVKPILHRFSWPRPSRSKVKLKFYKRSTLDGRLTPFPKFDHQFGDIVFSEADGYERVPPDGYTITIESTDPVEIRRVTDKTLREIMDALDR